MVQLVFMRLPQFSEDLRSVIIKQIKMRPGAMDQSRSKRKARSGYKRKDGMCNYTVIFFVTYYQNLLLDIEETGTQERKSSQNIQVNDLPVTPTSPNNNIVDMQGSISQSLTPEATNPDIRSSPLPSDNEFQNNLEGNDSISSNNVNEDNSISNDNEKVKKCIVNKITFLISL